VEQVLEAVGQAGRAYEASGVDEMKTAALIGYQLALLLSLCTD
jgi:hypothetical protein